MIYTLIGSVLMFLGILTLYYQHSIQFQTLSFDIAGLMRLQLSPALQWWAFWAFFLGFAVKVPMFPNRKTAIRGSHGLVVRIYRIYTGIVAERNDPLGACTGFEWDEGNAHKNCERHQVTQEEAEDVFFNEPLVVRDDARHTKQEKRYYALGQTGGGRRLFVAFTIRRSMVRVISVRDMNRNEREAYASHEEETDA